MTLSDWADYGSDPLLQNTLRACLTIVGALLLGIVVGYERTWNGRAAGIRTYGFVCMTSAALIVVVGHPGAWYGGISLAGTSGDPTRVIQGIVTGIGFLCAGVIMKEGFSISGLTTAASIWAVSAVGILVGLGFYATAGLLTLLSTFGMLGLQHLEQILPAHHELAIRLRCSREQALDEANLSQLICQHGFTLVTETLAIEITPEWVEWRFFAFTRDRQVPSFAGLATSLGGLPGILAVQLAHAKA